jgi:predicted DNA-binding transcriptional regulator
VYVSKLTGSVDSVRLFSTESRFTIYELSKEDIEIKKAKHNKPDRRVVKALTSFGLTENEIVIYTEALKLEESSPFGLAKATGIPRTTVYDVLTGLSLKGLVELRQSDGISKQQTRIKAKNPSVLRKILREKRKELTGVEIDILEILPQLKGDYHGVESHADFQFFPGIEGAKRVLFGEEQDEVDVPVVVFDNQMPMDAFGSKEMDESVDVDNRFRLRASTQGRELFILTEWTKHVLSYQYHRDPNYITARQLRYLEHPVLHFNQRIAIKGTGEADG